jgi:hypothetical protein
MEPPEAASSVPSVPSELVPQLARPRAKPSKDGKAKATEDTTNRGVVVNIILGW